MTPEEKVKELIATKELFTQEDYDLCMQVDPKSANEYLFYHKWNTGNHEYKNTWLNLNVYSERDKEEHDLRAELGY